MKWETTTTYTTLTNETEMMIQRVRVEKMTIETDTKTYYNYRVLTAVEYYKPHKTRTRFHARIGYDGTIENLDTEKKLMEFYHYILEHKDEYLNR